MRKTMIIAVISVLMTAILGGCNTVQGFGKDVQKGGEAIEKSAEKHH